MNKHAYTIKSKAQKSLEKNLMRRKGFLSSRKNYQVALLRAKLILLIKSKKSQRAKFQKSQT